MSSAPPSRVVVNTAAAGRAGGVGSFCSHPSAYSVFADAPCSALWPKITDTNWRSNQKVDRYGSVAKV